MSLENKKVLVTGAFGFIGSHLIQKLVGLGASVRAMTHYRSDPSPPNLNFLSKEELAEIEIIRGNIEDPFFVRTAVENCDVVFHLAALIAIPYSYVAPQSYVATNVIGTLNVLEACRIGQVSRLIHTSTSECYGTAQYTPMDENHPMQAQSPYAASKISADKTVESYSKSFSLPTVIIRPFNTYGPRQTARAIIPTIISQLISGVNSLKIGALTPIRDFTYVSDTVEGLILGGLASKIEGEEINLGYGEGISIDILANKIMGILGTTVPTIAQESRLRPKKSEVSTLISNNKKALKELHWKPKTSLKTGLEKTIEFIRQNQHLYNSDHYAI